MTHQNFIKKNAKSGINVKIFTNVGEPRLKGGEWMGLLDIFNTAGSSLPTPQILGLFKIHKEGIPLPQELLFTAHC